MRCGVWQPWGLAAQSTAALVNSRADLAPSGGPGLGPLAGLPLSSWSGWELSDEDGLDESCPLGSREGSVSRRTEAGAVEPQGLPGGCGASSPCFSRALKTHRALLVGGGEGCILGENGLNINRNESTVRPMRDMWGTGSQPGQGRLCQLCWHRSWASGAPGFSRGRRGHVALHHVGGCALGGVAVSALGRGRGWLRLCPPVSMELFRSAAPVG